MVDGDHGYGNALNVMRTVQELEHAGVFFFQAEDGIRYGHVTGVQTCALPISDHLLGGDVDRVGNDGQLPPTQPARDLRGGGQRSEERRVGKECRSRWSPY